MYYRNFLIAVLASVALVCTPIRADFTPIAGWDEQVFPSYLIATAAMKKKPEVDANTLGDAYSAFGITVTATEDNQPIRVTIACEPYAEASEYVGVLPKAGETYKVHPKIRYRFDRLSTCRQATPCSVLYKVQQGTEDAQECTATITMRSINDCPFLIVDGENVIDISVVFAAYVNEQHPFVDKLLREALNIRVVDSYTGYMDKDPNKVIAQVYSLWDLMVNRDVRYSNITTTAAVSNQIGSQHVRLLEETVNNTQANCVDGSVLFASMLRKVGIDAALVLTSDHCYIAFWADQEHKLLYGLETTMVSADLEGQEVSDAFDGAVAEDLRWDHSWASFVGAIQAGTAALQAEFDKEKSEIDFIDVTSARLDGILPIPFQGTEQFVAVDIQYSESDEVEEELTEEVEEASSEESSDTSEEVEWDSDESAPSDNSGSKNRGKGKSGNQDTVEWE